MPGSFQNVSTQLDKQLQHAFRYGTSAFRFGLIPQSVSDHLPITAELPLGTDSIKMLSWNLLADEHLFNNFMNISGRDYLERALLKKLEDKENNIYNKAIHHLLAEIAQYLLSSEENGEINITRELLNHFIPNNAQPSRKAHSDIPEVAQEKTRQVEEARSCLVDILCDSNDSNAHEYQLALKHCVELIYHIKSPDGALHWTNRFNRLTQNQEAIEELAAQDILAFQECTNPNDMENLLKKSHEQSRNITFIQHNLSRTGQSTDNVVLAFDTDKYQLVQQETPTNPLKSSFKGKKPALYCKLQDIRTGKIFIVGSIHHPGDKHDLRHEIEESVAQLQEEDTTIPFYIAGDYNHTAEQFACNTEYCAQEHTTLFYPTNNGTMAGSDYHNTNEAIDAIMSNQVLTDRIRVSPSIILSPPAPTPLHVHIALFEQPNQTHETVDAILKPHILETQVQFKQNVTAVRENARKSILEAMQPAYDDDTALGERTTLSMTAS
ncbi:MAG: hypothetical protein P1U61_03590 [Legionellaceae bacterium]|nr:hypothetical protein [Legionellaceae bacterium]